MIVSVETQTNLPRADRSSRRAHGPQLGHAGARSVSTETAADLPRADRCPGPGYGLQLEPIGRALIRFQEGALHRLVFCSIDSIYFVVLGLETLEQMSAQAPRAKQFNIPQLFKAQPPDGTGGATRAADTEEATFYVTKSL
jgi:hypothetical protein